MNLVAIVFLRGLQHNKNRVAILFNFGPLVGGQRIFNRQIVQPKLLLDFLHKGLIRLIQSQPDIIVRFMDRLADILDFYLFAPFSGAIDDAVYHHIFAHDKVNLLPGLLQISWIKDRPAPEMQREQYFGKHLINVSKCNRHSKAWAEEQQPCCLLSGTRPRRGRASDAFLPGGWPENRLAGRITGRKVQTV